MRKSSDDEIDDEDYDMKRNFKLRSDEDWLYGVPVSVLLKKILFILIILNTCF